jgi:ribose transport system substrate-binding protein
MADARKLVARHARWRHVFALTLPVLAVAGVLASTVGAASGGADPARRPANRTAKQYSVILINNFMGNTWRPVMMRTAELLAKKSPLNSRVKSIRLVVSDNNASSENSAINAAILAKPDILLVDAANSTASNQQIERACKAGITVVSFDVLVTAPCAWKIAVDFYHQGVGQAQYIANAIHGKGTILLDEGFQGVQSVNDWLNGAKSVLKRYPDIKTKTFYGQFSPGGETSGVTSLIASTPKIDGLLTHDYGAYGLEALHKAHRPAVPTAGFSYNISLLTCLKYHAPCLHYSSPTWVSGEALRLGVAVRDGKMGTKARSIILKAPWFTNNHSIKFPASGYPVLDMKKEALPKVNGGIMLPLSPPWAKLSTAEVLKKPHIG